MANILGLVTNNGKEMLEVDADPSAGAGTPAPIGSEASLELAGVGTEWIKVGAADTAWDRVVTFNSGANVASGAYRHLAVYDTNPGPGPHVADSISENSQPVDVYIVAQPTRTVGIDYIIPNPGDAISSAQFVLTEGDQTINGVKTFSDDVIVNGDLTVNGTLTFLNSTNTEITDKLITLNKGGATASGGGSGLEIEENALITAYLKQAADRAGWDFQNSANGFVLNLDQSLMTADHTLSVPDTDGVFVARPAGTPGVAGNIAFWSDANNIINSNNLFWDNTNSRLGIGTNAPSVALHVVGNARITGLSASPGVVHNDANGNLTSSAVVLTTEVSGVLPIANGGTNASTALLNNRVMVSSSGAIVENPNGQLTTGSVFFADSSGFPNQNNANFFWDNTNARLGLGTAVPARLLDVNGTSIFRSNLRIVNASAGKTNWEVFQAQVSTVDATVTTLATVAIPTDSEVLLKFQVTGRRSGGSAGTNGDSAAYERTARYKNVGGTVTINNLQTDYTSEDQTSWDGTMTVSGTNALIRVKGANNNNVDWTTTYFVQTLS